jgi:tRNA threonylcarbamoyl adenosine modification protein (Sua5/YciO/YrdC/YwlC family)
MIEYVVAHNPDDRVLERASRILKNGGLLCFPTETNWVVVADPFNKQGIDQLYRLRHVDNTKHFTVLCHDFKKAMEIAQINDGAFALMKKVVPGPYTFIFNAQKKIIKYLKASKQDHEVGIRFPPGAFIKAFLSFHDEVVISSHITADMMQIEDDSPIYSALIEDQFGNLIDLIIDPGEFEFTGPTTIIDFTSGVAEVVRQGAECSDLFKTQ